MTYPVVELKLKCIIIKHCTTTQYSELRHSPLTRLVRTHARTQRGLQSTIGSITGSQAWRASGEQDKAHAKASMQAAAEQRDPAKSGYGRAEEIAGKLTGCEGMKHEGAASRHKRSE